MKILLTGHGKMGKLLESTVLNTGVHTLAGIIDVDNVGTLSQMDRVADVIIDFSHPSMLEAVTSYAARTGTPLVSGTTGLTADQLGELKDLGARIPILQSSNYSYGVAVFRHVLAQIRDVLSGYDVEIVETHHNQKIDAPSGTAKLLLSAIDPEDRYEKVYGREGMCGARGKKEIGIHAIRGGTVAGEHTVSFFGQDEVLEITHKAASRQIFVDGALRAAEKLITMPEGYYSMEDILFQG